MIRVSSSDGNNNDLKGKRSILAINTLREAGYAGPMYSLQGGIDAMKDIIFPHEGAWL